MSMSYKSRRRWSIFLLLVGLPLYILVAWAIMGALPRLPILIELLIYAFLGVAWALPFKNVFKGVGKADPDETAETE
ncbi:DUF2842 domain-containing protein [Pontivivens nitratireducens]|uniref:DUF2842 domain-containing protein n=1 Tax=Pontivivens nitratireducens TaxID=2758038 RepID=UPI00163B4357|nr:DUF2842 domain-containing protein [Pontibrevibacter nitratireducens]